MGIRESWSAEELEYLEENYGMVSLGAMSKRLGRSVNAIRCMRTRLGLGPMLDAGDYVTWHQLVMALGITGGSGYMNISWIENRGCPVKYKTVENCRFKVIYLDDFWKWAEKNREFVDFSKMEPLILGKEPEWLRATRSAQHEKNRRYKKTPWAKWEDARLKQMIGEYKYSYDEISRDLGRTCGAIQRRCCDLGIKGRPVKAPNHNSWSDAEYATLAECIRQQLPYEIIADRLPGRSTKAIRGRVYAMYLTEDINRAAGLIGSGKWGDGRPDRKISNRTLSAAEKAQVRDDMTRFVGILKARICEHYESADYWQRELCQHWNSGCEAGETNCDECTSFIRIRPQFCKRCGKTFTERATNNFCASCRDDRKKAAQRKYMYLNGKHGGPRIKVDDL